MVTGMRRKRKLCWCQAGNVDTVSGDDRTLKQAISLQKLDQRHIDIGVRDSDGC